MKTGIYAIYDRVSNTIGNLMMAPALAAAIRTFTDIASKPDNLVGQHPEDFDLIQVGTLTIADADEQLLERGVMIESFLPEVVLAGRVLAAQQKVATPSGPTLHKES